MTTLAGGVIQALSVSQVESFDPTQTGGCPRRWYFERVEGHRPESSNAQTDGDLGHALLATYLRGGELPKRAKMLKHVRGAIAAGNLPTPGPDLLVEHRFDGQPARDASGTRIQLDVARTLHLGGVPWDGYVDLQFRRWKSVVEVVDHKFSSDIDTYAKASDGLIRTVQMPVYARNALRRWPDAREFRLTHHYVSRRGVASFLRSQVVTLDQVFERVAAVESVVAQMQSVVRATRQDDVPFERRACTAYAGCPHQSRCTAFRRNQMSPTALTAEELELFGPPETPAQASPAAESDDPFGPGAPPSPEPAKGYTVVSQTDVTAEEIPLVDIPLPVASKPTSQPAPTCECGATLTPDNSSRLQDNTHKHIGCPLTPAAAESAPATPPKRRGRPPKGGQHAAPPAASETCKTCGQSGAQTLTASGLQVHTGCKGAPEGGAEATTPNTSNGPRPEGAGPTVKPCAPLPCDTCGGDEMTNHQRFCEAENAAHSNCPDHQPKATEEQTNEGMAGAWARVTRQDSGEYVSREPTAETVERARAAEAERVAREKKSHHEARERRLNYEGTELRERVTRAFGGLSGTFRVEVDISDRLAAFLERLVGRPTP